MTNSPLATKSYAYHNKCYDRGGRKITRVILHHWAGTTGAIERFTNPSDAASVNYLVFSDGTIAVNVPEHLAAWTSGSWEADIESVTIEVQNAGGRAEGQNDAAAASWPITLAAFNALVNLIADIGQRNDWPEIGYSQVRGHQEFYPTACPGGYIWTRRGAIINAAASLFGEDFTPVPPTSKTITELAHEVIAGLHGNGADRMRSLGASYLAVQTEVNKILGAGYRVETPQGSIAQLADEVLMGIHGNGDDRVRSLGANYDAVQAEVNRRLGEVYSPVRKKSISELADEVMAGLWGNGWTRIEALGAQYNEVQAEVDRRYGLSGSTSPSKSIAQLADEVLMGIHGNGDDRVRSLGANYDAVQAEVNRRLA